MNDLSFALQQYEKTAIYNKNEFPYEIYRQGHTENPAISVIIPIYNTAEYLAACLDSVLQQSFLQIEVICVDDGSTDASLAVAEHLGGKDSRITILTQKHFGVSVARNNGLSIARGKYVYFIDSDDILLTNALETLFAKAEAEALDILYFNTECFTEDMNDEKMMREKTAYYKRKHAYPDIYRGEDMLYLFLSRREFLASVCLQLLRRDFLQRKRIAFYPGIIHQDELFSFTVILQAKRTGYVDARFYRRRLRKGSIMTSGLSFASAYGCFICFLEMEKLLSSLVLSEQNEQAAWENAVRLLKISADRYDALRPEEKCAVEGLSVREQALFKFYIVDHVLQLRRLEATVREKNRIITGYDARLQEGKNVSAKLLKQWQEEKNTSAKLSQQLQEAKKELYDIKHGYSFRMGRFLTFIPRKVRGGIRCYKEHGFIYTVKRTLWHLGFK